MDLQRYSAWVDAGKGKSAGGNLGGIKITPGPPKDLKGGILT